MSYNAQSLVLSCIDYRFINPTVKMMGDIKFDYTTIAGSSLGVNENKLWRATFTNQIDLAIKLHHIKEVVVVDHIDCGMYKNVYGELYSGDNRYNLHRESIRWAIQNISSKYPMLKVKGYLLDMNDIIHTITY